VQKDKTGNKGTVKSAKARGRSKHQDVAEQQERVKRVKKVVDITRNMDRCAFSPFPKERLTPDEYFRHRSPLQTL
jgi:hypothetical protein